MRKVLLVTAMSLLGAVSLWAFGVLVAVREAQPVSAASVPSGARPLEAARLGLVATVRRARSALAADERTPAVRALDAAKRASRVAEHAAPEGESAGFAEASTRVEQARRAVQDGDPAAAIGSLDRALGALTDEVEGEALPPGSPEGSDLSRWDGATLIDAEGRRIGELLRARGGGGEAKLALGGLRDVLGFLDLGGREVDVPLDRLLFGRPHTLGSTLVMLPRPAEEETAER